MLVASMAVHWVVLWDGPKAGLTAVSSAETKAARRVAHWAAK